MEPTLEYDDGYISSNTEYSINSTAIDLTTKISFLEGKKKQRILKKNTKAMQINITFNLYGESSTLQFTNDNLQSVTKNQIKRNFVQTSDLEPKRNSDCFIFPYIENASSIGSEDEIYELYKDLPVSLRCIMRDLKHPYYSTGDYGYERTKHKIIDTFKLNILYFVRKFRCNEDLPIIIYCNFCFKQFYIKGNLIRGLIQHIRKCSLGNSPNRVEYITEMMTDEEKSSKCDKQFSVLQLAREYITVPAKVLRERLYASFSRRQFQIISYECMLCRAGNFLSQMDSETEINDDYDSLYNHISSEIHQDFKCKLEEVEDVQEIMTKLHEAFCTSDGQIFRCELCNYESYSELQFINHLDESSHLTQLSTIPESERKNFDYYFCYACLLKWFGHVETYRKHDEKNEHKDKMPYYPYIEYMPKDCLDLLTYVRQNRQVIVADSNHFLQESRNVTNLIRTLKRDLMSDFPRIRAYPFGSRISGLASHNSDVDVFLDCESTYGGKITHARAQELIVSIHNRLLPLKEKWEIKTVVLKCRTPIIRILHIPTSLSCDIAVSNGLGVENTKMIKHLLEAFPTCRELILFLKRWLQTSNQSSFITSYALAWLVIFYLQQLKILPSISHLIKLKNKSRKISGWEIGVIHDTIPVGQTVQNFEELLFGLFRYYSEFDYNNHIICPLMGKELLKVTFYNRIYIDELVPYVNYIKRPTDRHTGNKPKRFPLAKLSVQDPFDLSHNITKATDERKLEKFRKSCKYASRYLKKTLTGITSKTIERYNQNRHKEK